MSFYDLPTGTGKTRVQLLVEKDPDGTKQYEKVSEHSTAVIADTELLARSLEYPNKYIAEGGLNDSLFQDAFTHGASAQRLINGWDAHAVEVHERFEARARARREGSDNATRPPDPDNLYVGTFHMTVAELRACIVNDDDDMRRVRVYDAGNESDPLHAEIIVNFTGLAKAKRKELRVRLMTLAQKRGLFVSPHLPSEHMVRADETECKLIRSPVEQADRNLCCDIVSE